MMGNWHQCLMMGMLLQVINVNRKGSIILKKFTEWPARSMPWLFLFWFYNNRSFGSESKPIASLLLIKSFCLLMDHRFH